MANKLYEENDIQAIANAIREKNGKSDKYLVSAMAAAIQAIEGGGGGRGNFVTGTFTLAEDKTTSSVPLLHNLGELPNFFLLYSGLAIGNTGQRYVRDAFFYTPTPGDKDPSKYTCTCFCHSSPSRTTYVPFGGPASGNPNGNYNAYQSYSSGSNCVLNGITDTQLKMVMSYGSYTCYFKADVKYIWIVGRI